MFFMQSFRVYRSRAFATRYWDELERQEFPTQRHEIGELVKSKWILDTRDGLITTEIGFLTMTILPTRMHFREDMTLIPGCDNRGNRGFLVLRSNRLPFHSLTTNARDAEADARAAHRRSDALIAHFGSREELKVAVRETPWNHMCIIGDVYNAGLCEWGVRNFMVRFKIRRFGKVVGMPSGVLRLVGNYGERIIAAGIVRSSKATEATKSSVSLAASSSAIARQTRSAPDL